MADRTPPDLDTIVRLRDKADSLAKTVRDLDGTIKALTNAQDDLRAEGRAAERELAAHVGLVAARFRW